MNVSAPPVPEHLKRLHAGWEWSVAWAYFPGVATHRLDGPDGELRFLKISSDRRGVSVLDECARTRWSETHLPVPEVIDCGAEGGVEWMLSRGIDAPDATSPVLLAQPKTLVAILARGLRGFHAAPVADCPFDFRIDTALALVGRRLESGLIDPAADLHPEHQHLTPEQAYAQLVERRPASEDLVVCHGDYCLPNILISGGEAVGFLDLGELGVADRWWDLAVATWSATWNLGPGWEGAFLDAYGIEADPVRIAWYRLLYDLVS